MSDESDPSARLLFVRENLMREQEFFWQRFYAFATLHAGAWVVATTRAFEADRTPIARAGLVLALMWVFTQWASLHYANRWKDTYYSMLEKAHISYSDKGVFSFLFGQWTWVSSTNVAVATTWGVLGAWLWFGGWPLPSATAVAMPPMLLVKALVTASYLLVVIGSAGMVLFATRFPFSTRIQDLRLVPERALGLNGHQVWKYGWVCIIAGTLGQLIGLWVQ